MFSATRSESNPKDTQGQPVPIYQFIKPEHIKLVLLEDPIVKKSVSQPRKRYAQPKKRFTRY